MIPLCSVLFWDPRLRSGGRSDKLDKRIGKLKRHSKLTVVAYQLRKASWEATTGGFGGSEEKNKESFYLKRTSA